MKTTVTSRGQTVVPARIREDHQIGSQTQLEWIDDGEIEFKDNDGKASGKRVYLQLKSGDSYLSARQRDDAEIFTIKNQRHVDYWQQQAYPVMLVILLGVLLFRPTGLFGSEKVERV